MKWKLPQTKKLKNKVINTMAILSMGMAFSVQAGEIFTSIQDQLKQNRKEFQETIDKTLKDPKRISYQNKILRPELHPSAYKYLFNYLNSSEIALLNQNKCNILPLLETHKYRFDKYGQIPVLATVGGEDIETVMQLEEFIKKSLMNTCQGQQQISSLYGVTRSAQTIKSIKIEIPKTPEDCSKDHATWISSPHLPFICSAINIESTLTGYKKLIQRNRNEANLIQGKISQLETFQKDIINNTTSAQRSLFKGLCNNIDNEKKYCDSFFGDSFFDQALTGNTSSKALQGLCHQLLNLDYNNEDQRKECLLVLKNRNEACLQNDPSTLASISNGYSCNIVDNTYRYNRLNTPKMNCAESFGTAGISNIGLILNHFFPKEFIENNCNYNVLNMLEKVYPISKKEWPFELCIKSERTNECKPYIPGNNPSDKNSENNITSELLQLAGLIPLGDRCEVISEKEYRPTLLKYKTGCYLTYKENRCFLGDCEKTLYINNKKYDNLTFKGSFKYPIIAKNFQEEGLTAYDKIIDEYKIKENDIRNLSELRSFFQRQPNGVARGIICKEDMPYIKANNINSLGECTGLPFLIVGFDIKTSSALVVSAFDNPVYPKKVHWRTLYSAIKNYEAYSPLRKWSLYGLYL